MRKRRGTTLCSTDNPGSRIKIQLKVWAVWSWFISSSVLDWKVLRGHVHSALSLFLCQRGSSQTWAERLMRARGKLFRFQGWSEERQTRKASIRSQWVILLALCISCVNSSWCATSRNATNLRSKSSHLFKEIIISWNWLQSKNN